jgi:hypothetical protein
MSWDFVFITDKAMASAVPAERLARNPLFCAQAEQKQAGGRQNFAKLFASFARRFAGEGCNLQLTVQSNVRQTTPTGWPTELSRVE